MVKFAPDPDRSRQPVDNPLPQDLGEWERQFPQFCLQQKNIARQRSEGGRITGFAGDLTAANDHATEYANPTSAHAQESVAVPAEGRSAGEPCLTADRPLPYDQEEWERHLAVARVRREKVLKRRAEERKRVAALEPDATAAGASDRQHPPFIAPVRDALVPRAADNTGGLNAKTARASADTPRTRLHSQRSVGRQRPVIFGLLIGCVAGASSAAWRSRLGAHWTVATSPPLDAAPSYLATLPLLQPPLSVSITDEGAKLVPAYPARAASVPIAAMSVPPAPAASPPALTAPADLAGHPATMSAPMALGTPPFDPRPNWGVLASDTAHARTDPGLSAPPTLAVPNNWLTLSPYEPLAPPQWQVSRVVVHAPEFLASDRREWALERLYRPDWPIEQATTPYSISETHDRFYHGRDRAAALELATLLDVAVRDFTGFSPSPEEGLHELWRVGRGAPRRIVRFGHAQSHLLRSPRLLPRRRQFPACSVGLRAFSAAMRVGKAVESRRHGLRRTTEAGPDRHLSRHPACA